MKRILLTTAAALGSAALMGPALAADLSRPAQMPVKAPAYAPIAAYNWTGFYIGINGGGAWGRSGFDFGGPSNNFNVSGGLVGGTVGFNYQTGPFVLGLEGDADWADIRGSTPCLGTFTCQTRNDFLSTVRGRIGYAFDRIMPYVTGGLAVGDIKASVPGIGSASSTRAGWTVGAGIEFALAGNWTAKAEYLYADLGSFDCGISCGVAPTNVNFNTNIVRAGLNYRF